MVQPPTPGAGGSVPAGSEGRAAQATEAGPPAQNRLRRILNRLRAPLVRYRAWRATRATRRAAVGPPAGGRDPQSGSQGAQETAAGQPQQVYIMQPLITRGIDEQLAAGAPQTFRPPSFGSEISPAHQSSSRSPTPGAGSPSANLVAPPGYSIPYYSAEQVGSLRQQRSDV